MSIQNLLKPNNYNLYLNVEDLNVQNLTVQALDAGDINAETINSQSVALDDLDSNSGGPITINKNLIPSGDDGPSLGSSTLAFSNLWCYKVSGNSGTFPVNIPNGLTLNSGPNIGSTLNIYKEYSGNLTVSGAISGASTPPITSVPYSGVIIGKLATVSFQTLLVTQAGASGTINLSGLPTDFRPLSIQSIFVPTQVNFTQNNSCLIISNATNPLISIFSAANETTSFTNGQQSGLSFASSRHFTFTYLLN